MSLFNIPYTALKKYLGPFYTYYNMVWKNHNQYNRYETVYYDFETTGLNPFHNKIIEYCFILEEKCDYILSNPKSYEDNYYISNLVNPETKFEKKITDITGIRPEEVENEEPIDLHIDVIQHFIDDENDDYNRTTYLVAHNNDAFDKLFLAENFKKSFNKEYKKWKFIDTLPLAKKLLPNLKRFSLMMLCNHFNLDAGGHRAFSDTVSLRNVYHKLLELLAVELECSKEFLLDNPYIVYGYIY